MRLTNLAVWGVHLLTASGGAIALFAVIAAARGAWVTVFLLLGLALVVDAVDGPLARRSRAATQVPWLQGATLDIAVDYATYVFVPAVVVAESELVPHGFRLATGAMIAVVGALYLADARMKTAEAAFRGFPAVWNVVVFQLMVFQLPDVANLVVLVALAALSFAPVEFVHPFRVKRLRRLTSAMAVAWGGLALAALAAGLRPGPVVTVALALVSLYFAVIGVVLQVTRPSGGPS